MHDFSCLVYKSCIEFTPKSYLFDHLLDSFLFLLCLTRLIIFVLCIFLSLFLFQEFHLCWNFFTETQFQGKVISVWDSESWLMNLFFILFELKKLLFSNFSWKDKTKDIDFLGLMEVTHWRVRVIVETLFFESPYDFAEVDFLFRILLDRYFDCDWPVLISLFLKNNVKFDIFSFPLWARGARFFLTKH